MEVGTLCPTGYRVMHIPRSHSAAGGVGIIFKNSICINSSLTDQYHAFGISPTHCALYKNSACLPSGLSTSLFLEEFSKRLEYITADQRHKRLLIVGDFNIHVDNSNDTTATQLWTCWTPSILYSMSARKHMLMDAHTLDLVISSAMDHFVNDVEITDSVISDNLAVYSTLHLEKSRFVKKVVSSRKLRGIDMTSFRSDIEGSVLLQHQDDLHVAVNNYDEVLRSLLDKRAPVKERVVTVRLSTPWYTAEVTAEKQKRRQLERKWPALRLPADPRAVCTPI